MLKILVSVLTLNFLCSTLTLADDAIVSLDASGEQRSVRMSGDVELSHSSGHILSMPPFPNQFAAEIVEVSHLLPKNSGYPSREKKMRVYYDHELKKSRVDIISGFDEGSSYIRDWNSMDEYRIHQSFPDQCSIASTNVPFDIPMYGEGYVLVENNVSFGELKCSHWVRIVGPSRHRILIDEETLLPVAFLDEIYSQGEDHDDSIEASNDWTLVSSFVMKKLRVGTQPSSKFSFENTTSCDNVEGGWPSVRAFHTILML